jgi:hypothetical protein
MTDETDVGGADTEETELSSSQGARHKPALIASPVGSQVGPGGQLSWRDANVRRRETSYIHGL